MEAMWHSLPSAIKVLTVASAAAGGVMALGKMLPPPPASKWRQDYPYLHGSVGCTAEELMDLLVVIGNQRSIALGHFVLHLSNTVCAYDALSDIPSQIPLSANYSLLPVIDMLTRVVGEIRKCHGRSPLLRQRRNALLDELEKHVMGVAHNVRRCVWMASQR